MQLFLNQSQNIDFYYKKTDIVISTSSFGEGLQNIILEGICTEISLFNRCRRCQ